MPNYWPGTPGPKLRDRDGVRGRAHGQRGAAETVLLDDGWTVVTADGSLSAHFEHTIAVTDDGPEVLTVPVMPRSSRPASDPKARRSCSGRGKVALGRVIADAVSCKPVPSGVRFCVPLVA